MSEEDMKRSSSSIIVGENHAYVLAFDVEKLGQFSENPVIEIGAAMVGPYPGCRLLDEFSYSVCDVSKLNTPEYPCEPLCMTEFWDKPENRKVLDSIDRDSAKTSDVELERKAMIEKFIAFVNRWEVKTGQRGKRLWRATDNAAYDPAAINTMIEKYCPGTPIFPYWMNTGKYGALPETHSMQWGVLLGHGVTECVDKYWGLSKAMLKHFDFEQSKVASDHRARNDAYNIAYELQVCLAIGRGDIKKREVPLTDDEVNNLFCT